jgi:hypothetical protein
MPERVFISGLAVPNCRKLRYVEFYLILCRITYAWYSQPASNALDTP